jgi:hypothetical protein
MQLKKDLDMLVKNRDEQGGSVNGKGNVLVSGRMLRKGSDPSESQNRIVSHNSREIKMYFVF